MLIAVLIVLLAQFVRAGRRYRRPFSPKTRGDSLQVHGKVGISDLGRALRSLRMPNLIPLLFGNSIQSYSKANDGYEINHSPKLKTELFPLQKRRHLKFASIYSAGFVIKRSSFEAFPVPMENTMVVVRLVKVYGSNRYALLHIWLTSQGIYTSPQLRRQKIYTRSLLQDFADNAQRSLGVKNCPNFPTISGLCNNRGNSVSGSTFQPLLEEVKLQRVPTSQLVALSPNPRLVSNTIFKSAEERKAPRMTNLLMVFFGQFIDHEVTATPSEQVDPEANAAIPHPDGKSSIHFKRSGILRYSYKSCCGVPYTTRRVWEGTPFNQLTSFVDGGAIYGSNNLRANILRKFNHGELILRGRGSESLLPMNTENDLDFLLHNEGEGHLRNLFVAGDSRANENPVLLSLHTIFAREHNRVCALLRRWVKRKPLLTDNWLYTQARQIVIAELQSITFNEFVPAMLGRAALSLYEGYDPKVDARVSTLFASFAYRWGHSAVSEKMKVKDRKGNVMTKTLKDLFFNSNVFKEHGVDNLLLSAMNTAALDVDLHVSESLRNFLFNPTKPGVLDLITLNIHRSRDVGSLSYDAAQKLFKTGRGMENIREDLQPKLLDLYGSVEKIDAFVGGLAEKKVEGSLLGPLFHAINVDQFKRLRDGDRFYYENIHWHSAIVNMPLVQEIRNHQIRLIDVIMENTGISYDEVGWRDTVFKTKTRTQPY